MTADLLPQEAAARDAAPDGALFAWVQPLQTLTGRRAKTARLWVDRKGQRPTETVFSLEHLSAAVACEIADAINRGRRVP